MRSAAAGLFFVTLAVVGAAGCPSEVPGPGCQGAGCKEDDTPQEPPRVFVDPPFGLGFDCVTIGCDVERRMVVENRGGGALSLVLARIAVGSSTDFTMRTGSGDPLPFDATTALAITPETPLELFVRYVPGDGTADQGTVHLDWHDATVAFEDAVLDRVELPLSTRALGDAAATPSVTRLNFGFVPVGGYATRTLRVDNTGSGGVLGVGPIALEDGTPPVFLEPVAGAWGSQFANPGQGTEIAVNFRPDATGTFTGAVLVQTTDGANPAIRVEVAGTAVAEPDAVVVGASSLDFQAIRVGTTRTLPLVIENRGGAPLTLQGSIGAGVGLSLDVTAPIEVAALERATFQVTWAPVAGGPLTGRVVFSSNDPAQASFNVDVGGFANAPVLAATPTTTTFGNVVQGWTTEARSFELRNTGFGELTISSLVFEVGSSSQIRFAEVPNLPVKLSPNDPPVVVSLFMEASTLGTQRATILVGTDGVDGPLGQGGVGRLTATGVVVTCEQGCPMANAEPSCGTGACTIGTCTSRFHDADDTVGNGCECGEDLRSNGIRTDIAGTCDPSGRFNFGDLGDGCAGKPNEARFSGTIHGLVRENPRLYDSDLFFFTADDGGNAFCDTFGDSFEVSVRIEGAPAGLRVCGRAVARGTGCGGEEQRVCGGTSLRLVNGSFASDDDRDVTVWVEWTPGQERDICANYTLVVRSKD